MRRYFTTLKLFHVVFTTYRANILISSFVSLCAPIISPRGQPYGRPDHAPFPPADAATLELTSRYIVAEKVSLFDIDNFISVSLYVHNADKTLSG